MSTLRRLVHRIIAASRAVIGDTRADVDLRAELDSHLAMQIDENVRRGMSPDDARRQALLDAGGLSVATELVHERRGLPWIEETATDIRHAARGLVAKAGFTAAVVLTLGLGIGANTAMFTMVNAVVLRPLPYPDPDRIISVSLSYQGADREVVNDRDFFAWVADVRSAIFAVYSSSTAVVKLPAGPEEIRGMAVSASYFAVLGFHPFLGRTFTPDEDRPGGPPVIVLSEQLWRRAFGRDSGLVGRSILVDGKAVTVVGVLPASFATPSHPEYWIPYRLEPAAPGTTFYYQVVGRLRAGASIESLRTELATITARIDAVRPAKDRGLTPVVMTLHERRYGEQRTPLLLLLGAVGVLLLIACANLANLALARAASRQREFAMRLALGASRWRLVRSGLTESMLLSTLGGALGVALAVGGVAYFVRLSPASVGNVEGIRVDGPVLLFTLAVTVATGIVFGLAPAIVAGRQDLHRALAAGGPRGGTTVRQQRVRRLLVVGQLATALVLLTAAGLVARTFAHVASIDPGFRPEGLVAASFRLPEPTYSDETAAPFFEEALARVKRVPGVQAATLVDVPPIAGVRMSVSTTDSAGRESPRIDVVAVGVDYFKTIGARLVEGRSIDANDRRGATRVVVANRTLARQLFPNTSAVGRTFPFHGGATIVGVVDDVLQRSLETPPMPVAYEALTQEGLSTSLHVLARTEGPVSLVEAAIVQITRSLDSTLPPPAFTLMDEAVAQSLAPRKFTFMLLAIFAMLAATLAVVGLYGLLAHVVSDRTREIGIRAALGADRRRVVWMVVRQGAVLIAMGVAVGLVAAFALRSLVVGLLYGVSVADPATFTAIPLVLAAAAMIATVIPAWRAARVDPVIALRAD